LNAGTKKTLSAGAVVERPPAEQCDRDRRRRQQDAGAAAELVEGAFLLVQRTERSS
jgi:hypothetical protein